MTQFLAGKGSKIAGGMEWRRPCLWSREAECLVSPFLPAILDFQTFRPLWATVGTLQLSRGCHVTSHPRELPSRD